MHATPTMLGGEPMQAHAGSMVASALGNNSGCGSASLLNCVANTAGSATYTCQYVHAAGRRCLQGWQKAMVCSLLYFKETGQNARGVTM